MNDLIKQVATLAELQKQATPGPWAASTQGSGTGFTGNVWFDGPGSIWVASPGQAGNRAEQFIENARFIAAAGSLDFAALAAALPASTTSVSGGAADFSKIEKVLDDARSELTYDGGAGYNHGLVFEYDEVVKEVMARLAASEGYDNLREVLVKYVACNEATESEVFLRLRGKRSWTRAEFVQELRANGPQALDMMVSLMATAAYMTTKDKDFPPASPASVSSPVEPDSDFVKRLSKQLGKLDKVFDQLEFFSKREEWGAVDDEIIKWDDIALKLRNLALDMRRAALTSSLGGAETGGWAMLSDDLPESGRWKVAVHTDEGDEVHTLELSPSGDWIHEGEATYAHGYYFSPYAYAPIEAAPADAAR